MLSLRAARAVVMGGKLSTRQLGLNLARQTIAFNALRSGTASPITQQRRLATTTTPTTSTTTPAEAHSILTSQRLKRPLSPHLSIYRPQITSVMSIFNRITGGILSGGVYVFLLSYLIAPYLGWHLETASLAAAFGALPVAAKVGIKAIMAAPFTYHSINGVRHLIWDSGRQLSIPAVYKTGYAVLGATAVSTVALALL